MEHPVNVKIKIDENLSIEEAEVCITQAHEGDAGFDIRAVGIKIHSRDAWGWTPDSDKLILQPHQTIMIYCGFSMALPEGYEAQVRPRSGLAKRGITVANSPGTIDSGYRGPVCVLLHNMSNEQRTIHRGDRIAQLVIQKVPTVSFSFVRNFPESSRGSNGFGSSGK